MLRIAVPFMPPPPIVRACAGCDRASGGSGTRSRRPCRSACRRTRPPDPTWRGPPRSGPSTGGSGTCRCARGASIRRNSAAGLSPFPSSFLHRLEQVPEGTQVQVEVLVGEPEHVLELIHPFRQGHEGSSEALDLLVAQRAGLDPPHGLALHQLTQQLDQREDELGEALLESLRV